MPSNAEFLAHISQGDIEEIERGAAANLAPNQIANLLNLNKAAFMRLWREKKSVVRQAWDRGRSEIQQKKFDALELEIETGNITAIQIHDKLTEQAEFEAKKQEIFGFDFE